VEENKKLSQEDLRDWFGKGGKGGVGGGGWDRYSTSGNRVGKCGDAKEGEPYSACLSKEKAKKLGKSGIAAFVKRKRDAQKKGGDAKKGGEKSKGQKPIKVKTGVNEEVDLLEQVNMLLEKNEPTDPQKWAYAKSQAKEKFDVYPSAYGNAWAAKKYKELGGKWRKKKAKKKNMKEELSFIREKVKSVILELYSLNELKYDDLTSSEKGSYDNRNTKVLQDKIKPLKLQTTKGDVSMTPIVKISPDWIEYKLSEGRDDFFSLSMKNSSEVNIYFTSKLWDFNVDEFNLGISISKFLIDASDYVDFLDESVIKKVERVVNYHLRKKESYINQTIKL
jgi:hypothetical protein